MFSTIIIIEGASLNLKLIIVCDYLVYI